MSEFGGFQKDEKTQHALVGLSSAAVAEGSPNFPEGIIKCKNPNNNHTTNNKNSLTFLIHWIQLQSYIQEDSIHFPKTSNMQGHERLGMEDDIGTKEHHGQFVCFIA